MNPQAIEKRQEFRTGAFVLIGLILTCLAILILGGRQSIFTSTVKFSTHFSKVDGLVPGAKVTLGGLQIGSVRDVDFSDRDQDIVVHYSAEKKYQKWIRQDSTIEIVTQGVLGDKYLSIIPGNMELPMIEDNGTIQAGGSKDLSHLFNSSEQLMVRLSSSAENLNRILEAFNRNNRADAIFQSLAATLKGFSESSQKLSKELDRIKIKSSIDHLDSILEKIDSGKGSIGALINDPALYDDAKALVGQTNRNRVMRNLIRQTIQEGTSSEKK